MVYGYDDIAAEAAAGGPGFDVVVVEGEMDKLAVDAALCALRELEARDPAELTEEEHVVLARFRGYRAVAVSVPNGALSGYQHHYCRHVRSTHACSSRGQHRSYAQAAHGPLFPALNATPQSTSAPPAADAASHPLTFHLLPHVRHAVQAPLPPPRPPPPTASSSASAATPPPPPAWPRRTMPTWRRWRARRHVAAARCCWPPTPTTRGWGCAPSLPAGWG